MDDVAIGPHLSNDHDASSDVPLVAALEHFETFFRREYRGVVGLAAVLCGDRATAEDLAQEAFAATIRQWDRVGRMDQPGAWVRRIVANKSVSRFRRAMLEVKALPKVFGSGAAEPGLDAEIAVDIWREVRRLPKRQAQAIALTDLADLSRREVAEILGCSEETVKTHLERGRVRLADHLAEYGERP
jgi:RNA polymerase sigma-70 factor (ECF subfamily)